KPTNVSAGSITNDSITLTWTKSSGATSYEVRYNRETSDFTDYSDVGNVASYTFTGLTASRDYALQVRAKNANGVSSHVTARATTLDGPNKAPPRPTNLRVTRITHNSITISWTKSPGATSYEGLRSFGSTGWFNYGNVDSYTIIGSAPDTFINAIVAIRARNAYGASGQTTVSIMTTTLPAPPGYGEGGDDDDEGDEEDDLPRPTPMPTATPIRDTLNRLPPGIQVNNWVDGAQGQRVKPVGVGRADVIPHHEILNAVNIWGYVTPGIEVCFDQPGRLLFVDSVYPPIAPFELPAHRRDGMTCATIDTAGTVVLLRGESSPEQSLSQSQNPPPLATAKPSGTQRLSGCEVRPWANVKFRQSPPGGEVISVTSIRKWLPASETRYGYFKVPLWGREGWISGRFVYTRGNCGS
ncbi:MAG: fibronectin type III domain-containing protein, partial [Chloroflexota bacterium]|nr:fibronectin type III domain-containing protein [Chloroflexota bacterium]